MASAGENAAQVGGDLAALADAISERAQLELDLDGLDKKRALVAEARVTFGIAVARRLWVELGLPQVPGREGPRGSDLARRAFDRFLQECTVTNIAAEVRSRDLYRRYELWARAAGAQPLSAMHFGKLAHRSGILSRKSYTTIYLGIALRPERSR